MFRMGWFEIVFTAGFSLFALLILLRIFRALWRSSVDARLWKEIRRRNNRSLLAELRDQIAADPGLLLFCGSGISVSCGFPTWTQMLKDWGELAGIRDLIEALIAKELYEEGADTLALERGERWIRSQVFHTFRRSPGPAAYRGIPALLPRLSPDGVLTSNFDRVLEAAFEKAGRPFKVVGYPDELGPMVDALEHEDCRPFLLKLHGDASSMEHYILTGANYARHYGKDKGYDPECLLPKTLLRLLRMRTFLFIGCGLKNDRFLLVLKDEVKRENLWNRHYALCSEGQSVPEGINPIYYPITRVRGKPDQHTALGILILKLLPVGTCSPQDERAYGFLGIITFALATVSLLANRIDQLKLYWVTLLAIPILSLFLVLFVLPLSLWNQASKASSARAALP